MSKDGHGFRQPQDIRNTGQQHERSHEACNYPVESLRVLHVVLSLKPDHTPVLCVHLIAESFRVANTT
jgi:hypothetical protein